jgi:excisionase family DNA binding protein
MGNNSFSSRLLSQKAAAAYLGISYWTLRDLCFRGDIPHVQVKRRVLVDRVDLDAYVTRCKIRAGG